MIYLLKASICITVFFLIYRYIYNKYSFFEWNRIFLITTILLSLLIPLIKQQWLQDSSKLNFSFTDILFVNLQNNEIFISTNKSSSFFTKIYDFISSRKYLTIINIVLIIYISGIIRYTIIFVRNLLSINKLKKNAQKSKIENYTIYQIKSKITAFSFFRNIFTNNRFTELSKREQEQIIEHEKIHIKQLHTLDVLFFEIINIIFWFNPLNKQIKKALVANHEFIVDSELIKKDSSYNYSKLMLKLSGENKLNIINNYVAGQLKNRVNLIINPEKEKIRKIRFLSSIPVILLIIFTFIFTFNILETSKRNKEIVHTEFIFPVKNNYKIITPFFSEKIITDPNNKNIKFKISHEKLTIETESFAKIYATSEGTILKIDTINNWGIQEINITLKFNENYTAIYEKLAKTSVKEKQKVKKGQKIGLTGDKRLYPVINYQLLYNQQPIMP